jgi:hypothetical protein
MSFSQQPVQGNSGPAQCFAPNFLDSKLSVFMPQLFAQENPGELATVF